MKYLIPILAFLYIGCQQHSKGIVIHEDTSDYKNHPVDSEGQRIQDSLGTLYITDNIAYHIPIGVGDPDSRRKDYKDYLSIYENKHKVGKELVAARIEDNGATWGEEIIINTDSDAYKYAPYSNLQIIDTLPHEWRFVLDISRGGDLWPHNWHVDPSSRRMIFYVSDSIGPVLYMVNDSIRVIDTMGAIRCLIKEYKRLDSILAANKMYKQ